MDVTAGIAEPRLIEPREILNIPAGFIIEIPKGFEGQLRARSGLALNAGICLANGVGTIDSDYRGEVSIILLNVGSKAHIINPGDRICQLLIAPVRSFSLIETDSPSDTARGAGGFGSTGDS